MNTVPKLNASIINGLGFRLWGLGYITILTATITMTVGILVGSGFRV